MISFKNVCTRRKKNYQESYVFDFTRLWSLPFTYVLVNTPLTPNMISFLSFALLVVSCGFIIQATPFATLVGGIICWFSWVLDCVDGEVARLRGIASNFGGWLDMVFDRLGDVVLFAAITINLYKNQPTLLVVVIGLFAIISTTLWRHMALATKTAFNLPLTEKNPLKRIGFDTATMYLMLSLALIFNGVHIAIPAVPAIGTLTPLVLIMLFFAVVINLVTLKNIAVSFWRFRK